MNDSTSVVGAGKGNMIWGILMLICGFLAITIPFASGIGVAFVIGWLLLRSLILLGALTESGGSVRRWTALSAGMDFLLAVLLITGLSISTIVVSVFGPTRELVASFAWVLAASFVVNGLLLLEVAGCEREAAA